MSKNSIRRHIKVVHLNQKRSDQKDPLLSEANEQNNEEEQLLNCNQCSYKTMH